jgi:hypothetical protein
MKSEMQNGKKGNKMSLEEAKSCIRKLDERKLEKRAKRLSQVGIIRITSIISPEEISEVHRFIELRDPEKFTTRFMVSKFKWQAYICYVYGFYESTIIMCGASLETLLKLELENEEIDISGKPFKEIIDLAFENDIIDKNVRGYLNKVRRERNRVHFKPPEFEKISIREFVADYIHGDAFTSWTDPGTEKRMWKRTKDVLDKMQKVINYFSQRHINN